MVEALFRRYVDKDGADRLDFSTLQLMNPHFVSEEFQQRESDLVWEVQLKDSGERLYLYVLLELQSTVDRFMARRLLTYLLLLYEWLARQKKLTPSGLLPPVLPLVLYNGAQPWNAARELAELVEKVPGFERFAPRFRRSRTCWQNESKNGPSSGRPKGVKKACARS